MNLWQEVIIFVYKIKRKLLFDFMRENSARSLFSVIAIYENNMHTANNTSSFKKLSNERYCDELVKVSSCKYLVVCYYKINFEVSDISNK